MNALRKQFEHYLNGAEIPDVPLPYAPFTPPAVECTICNDAGFIVQFDNSKLPGSEGWQRTVPCPDGNCPIVRRNLEARYEKLVSKAPLPPEYIDLQFEDWARLAKREGPKMQGKWLGFGAAWVFVQNTHVGHWFRLEDAYAAAGRQEVAPNAYLKNSIVLSGAPGVGKTSLAACIVNHLRGAQIPALYMRVSHILDALREPMNDDKDYLYEFGRTEQQILATFSKAPVLVLDEFNLARVSDYSKQKLEDIIRHRMMYQLPTVMTTNLTSFEDFNDHWGYRVGHAVQGMAHWIIMSGPELRRRGGEVQSV